MNFYFIINNFFYIYFIFVVGFLVNKKIIKLELDKNLTIIFGIIYASLIGLLINFFFPLSNLVNTTFFTSTIIISFFYYKEILNNKNIKLFFIIGLINILLLLGAHHNRPDALVYHLPYIATLNEEKIIFGLNNINYRFGHTGIIQYLSAISYNYFFGINGISLYLPLAFSSLLYFFYEEIKKNKNNILCIVSVFFICIILLKFHRVSEYGNDYWSHFYLILSFYLVFKSIQNNQLQFEEFFQISLLLFFAFLNKIFFIIGGIFLFYILIKFNKKNYLFNKKIFFILFFLIIFFTKNIINTGCIIYPLDQTCFNKLSWTAKVDNYGNAKKVAVDSEAWSKDWPNFFKKNEKKITQEDYISNFNWINTWGKNHLLLIIKKLIPVTTVILLMFFLLRRNNQLEKSFDKFLFWISLLLLLIWFLKFPLLRFGLSIILITISCIFFIIIQNFKLTILSKKNIYFLVICCCLIASLQNLKKIVKNNDQMIPYLYDDQNHIKIYDKNNFVMHLNNQNYCGLTPLCSNYNNSKNIVIDKFLNYKFYKIK